jgi:hypothetical protein
MDFAVLKQFALVEGLPPADESLAAAAASISIGRQPVLLGSGREDLLRLARAFTAALTASFSHATVLQIHCTAAADLSFRVNSVASEGWVVVAWFTDRPDLSFRFDVGRRVDPWRAVLVTTARYHAIIQALDPGRRRRFALIETPL